MHSLRLLGSLGVVAGTLFAGANAQQQQLTQVESVPEPAGGEEDGWLSITKPPQFELERLELWAEEHPGVTVPTLVFSNCEDDKTKCTNVLINWHGKGRDVWEAARIAYNGFVAGTNQGYVKGGTKILVPMFTAEQDSVLYGGGAALANDALWPDRSWAAGWKNRGPEAAGDLTSFDAMDVLVRRHLNTTIFPNVERVVLMGHSLGGQAVQRYQILRKDLPIGEPRFHILAQNPGAYAYLTDWRPFPEKEEPCKDTYDEWKYGIAEGSLPSYDLAHTNDLGRQGLVDRYQKRGTNLHLGDLDDGLGDTSCEAQSQGHTHKERGLQYQEMLKRLYTSIPDNTNSTVEVIPDVSHQQAEMVEHPKVLEQMWTLAPLSP